MSAPVSYTHLDQELKEGYAARQPYGEWLDTNLLRLADLPIPNQRVERHSREELSRLQKAFGYTCLLYTSTGTCLRWPGWW